MVGWWVHGPGSRRSQGLSPECLEPLGMSSAVKGKEMGWCLKSKEGGAVSVNSGGSKLEEGCKNRMETGGGHKGFWKEMYPCSIIYEDELRSELSSSDKAAGRVSLLLQHCG